MLELIFRSQFFLVLVLALNIILLIMLLVREKIHVGYALIWIMALLLATAIVVSNKFLMFITRLFGAKIPASALAYMGFAFIFFVLIYFSTKISMLSDNLKKLTQYVALLEKRLEDRAESKKEGGEKDGPS